MTRSSIFAFSLLAATGVLLLVSSPSQTATQAERQLEQEQSVLSGDQHEFGDGFMLALGGKLYDDVWSASDATPPMERNPAFPSDQEVTVSDSWRCVSCHGWDYDGAEKAPGSAQQQAQFTSLKQLQGQNMLRMRARFTRAHPNYLDGVLDDLPLELILLFLSAGQVDHDAFDLGKPVSPVNMARGQDIFEGVCMNCHDPDGTAGLPPRDGRKPSLGWLARREPNRVLHRIINGFPGQAMLALRFMEDDAVRDLIAYMRTLDPDTP